MNKKKKPLPEKKTWGGKRIGAGFRKKMPLNKRRVPLRVMVDYSTLKKILKKYGRKEYGRMIDEEMK